jgi:hypothetical protein
MTALVNKEIEERALVKKEEDNGKLIPLEFQEEVAKFVQCAGTIKLTNEQELILYDPVKEDDVEIRPDGLVYLPWMEYVSRLRKAFGLSWAIIPQGMPKFMKDSEMIYWGFYLVVEGKLSGFAIGEQRYQPTNATMTYGDACEGAKSNALMRLCKGLGISLELWKPSFVKAWKEKYAESYPGVWPDGKPMKDKFNNQKMLWRKKGKEPEIHVEEPEGTSENETEVEEAPSPGLPPPDQLPGFLFPTHEAKRVGLIQSAKQMLEIKNHMNGWENKFEASASWRKNQAEWKKQLTDADWKNVMEYKDQIKEKLNGEN